MWCAYNYASSKLKNITQLSFINEFSCLQQSEKRINLQCFCTHSLLFSTWTLIIMSSLQKIENDYMNVRETNWDSKTWSMPMSNDTQICLMNIQATQCKVIKLVMLWRSAALHTHPGHSVTWHPLCGSWSWMLLCISEFRETFVLV